MLMRRAYLVLHLNTSTTPPTVTSADVYSVSAQNLSNGLNPEDFAVDVLVADGKDFSQANERLRQHVAEFPPFAWIRPLLRGE
jgi:hypothetical protein